MSTRSLYLLIAIVPLAFGLDRAQAEGFGKDAGKNPVTLVLQSGPLETPVVNRDILTIYDSHAQPSERLQAVHDLADDLSRQEIVLLYNFLEALPSKAESNLGGLRYVKNEVFNVLRDQQVAPADLIDVSINVYRNAKQDFVTRDYAVQNLANWCAEITTTAEQQTAIYNALVEAAHDGTSIAGTAIVNLDRVFKNSTSHRNRQIDEIALEIATSTKADSTARSSAIQVCSERGLTQVLPTIERLAQGQEPNALRLSAIAALGALGGSNAGDILRQLQVQGDEDLRPAVEAALHTFQHKLSKTSVVLNQRAQ